MAETNRGMTQQEAESDSTWLKKQSERYKAEVVERQKQFDETSQRLRDAETKIGELQTDVSRLDRAVKKKDVEINKLMIERNKSQDQYNGLKNQYDRLKDGHAEDLRREVDLRDMMDKRAAVEVTKLKKQIAEKDAEIAALKEQLKNKQA